MFDVLADPEAWLSLATLTLMEIVLGIDNIIFISILTGKLAEKEQRPARQLGISLALILRLGLLLSISWVMGLTEPFFTALGREISGRDLILFGGGLFLIAKATHEIYEKLEVPDDPQSVRMGGARFGVVLAQILALDVVFSLDSVITAVGMASRIPVMVIAMVAAVGVMLVFAGAVSDFVNRHPSMKILALAFLLLIGVMLVADGTGHHLGKGYIYFAMAFSLFVEMVNMRVRKNRRPVELHRGL